MATVIFDEAIKLALDFVPRVDDLKKEQKLCIEALLEGRDVLGLLPTGFGKSLIYQLHPKILELMKCETGCSLHNRYLLSRVGRQRH